MVQQFLERNPQLRVRFILSDQVVNLTLTGEGVDIVLRIADLRESDLNAVIEAACRGLGLCRALSYQVEPQLADGSLVLVLVDYEPPPVPVNLLYPGGLKALRARAFVDFAAPRLQRDAARLQAWRRRRRISRWP